MTIFQPNDDVRRGVTIVCSALLALCVIGCSGDDDGGGSDVSTPQSPPSSSAVRDPETTVAETPDSVRGTDDSTLRNSTPDGNADPSDDNTVPPEEVAPPEIQPQDEP
jgi:hypothetical protein